MNVLRNKNSTNNGKRLVGGYVPQHLYQALYLKSLAEGVSINQLVEKSLTETVGDIVTIPEMVNKIIDRANHSYRNLNTNSKRKFRSGLRAQLTNKKVDESIIDEIINGIKL